MPVFSRPAFCRYLLAAPLLIVGLLLVSCDSGNGSPPPPEEVPPAWSDLEQVPIELENPSLHGIAADGSTVYLTFGDVSNQGRFPGPGDVYVIRREGSQWSEPTNLSQNDAPSSQSILTVGPNGVVHAVWGERIAAATQRPGGRPDAIFYASKEEGAAWSDPVTVFESSTDAGFSFPRSIALDGQGHPHIVFSQRVQEQETGATYPIKHMKRVDGSWSDSRTLPHEGGSPDIAVGPGGRLFVAFIAADSSQQASDRNSVFATTSSDDGQTWSERTLVDRSGFDQPAAALQALVDSEGRSHVLWSKSLDGDLYPDAIYHSFSHDASAWSEASNLASSIEAGSTPFGTMGISDVTADEQGNMHVAISTFADDVPPYYVRWNGTRWQPPEEMPGLSIHLGSSGRYLHAAARKNSEDGEGIYYGVRDLQ